MSDNKCPSPETPLNLAHEEKEVLQCLLDLAWEVVSAIDFGDADEDGTIISAESAYKIEEVLERLSTLPDVEDGNNLTVDKAEAALRRLMRDDLVVSPPSPERHTTGVDAPIVNALVLQNALEMTGCDDEADLIDMANVGNSLMERIDRLVGMPGPYHGWSPADDPAEIVFDLVNDLDELREQNNKIRAAVREAIELLLETRQGSPARSPGHNARLCLQSALTMEGQP